MLLRWYSTKPNLKEFLHQQKVKNFYRQVMRSVYEQKEPMKTELREYAKSEFHTQGNNLTLDDQKYLLSIGERQYHSIKSSLESAK